MLNIFQSRDAFLFLKIVDVASTYASDKAAGKIAGKVLC